MGGSTGQALATIATALAGVDHASRRGLAAAERLALVLEGRRLAGRLAALVAVLVAEADEVGASRSAHGTPLTTWLTLDERTSAKEASALVFAARDVAARGAVRDAALAGRVSVAQARSIAKVMRELPDTLTDEQRGRAEGELLARAERTPAARLAGATASVLEVVSPLDVESPEMVQERLEAQRKRAQFRRELTFTPDGDGSVLLRGSLPDLAAAGFMKVIDAHVESARRAARDRSGVPDADAAGGGTRLERRDRLYVEPTLAQRRADALMVLVEKAQAGRVAPRLAGDRPRVVVTVRESDLRERAEQAGLLESGSPIGAGDLRRLCCDADLVAAVLGAESELLDLGTEVRLVEPALRAALALRDGGCAFPACPVPADRCEAHHVVPWWAGGETALANLALLCSHHHTLVEPTRFLDRPAPDRWQLRISEVDGLPEAIPPLRLDPERRPRRQHRHERGQGDRPEAGHPPRPPTG